MILDPIGRRCVWFKPLPRDTSATNLRVQEYAGRPVLTWWQGDISIHGFGLGEDVISRQHLHRQSAHVRAGNGHRADLHDFQLTPQGHGARHRPTSRSSATSPRYGGSSHTGP